MCGILRISLTVPCSDFSPLPSPLPLLFLIISSPKDCHSCLVVLYMSTSICPQKNCECLFAQYPHAWCFVRKVICWLSKSHGAIHQLMQVDTFVLTLLPTLVTITTAVHQGQSLKWVLPSGANIPRIQTKFKNRNMDLLSNCEIELRNGDILAVIWKQCVFPPPPPFP